MILLYYCFSYNFSSNN